MRRKRGIPIDGARLSQLMAERALRADELAAMAGVSEDVVVRARRGRVIERNSLLKLTDALLRAPAVNPLVGQLVSKNETAAVKASAAVKKENADVTSGPASL